MTSRYFIYADLRSRYGKSNRTIWLWWAKDKILPAPTRGNDGFLGWTEQQLAELERAVLIKRIQPKKDAPIYQNLQSALVSKVFTTRETKVIEFLQVNQGAYRKDVESRFADVHYLPSLLQKLNPKLERLCGQKIASKRIVDGRARYYLISGQSLDKC